MATERMIHPATGTRVSIDGERAEVTSTGLRLPLQPGEDGQPGTAEVVEAHEDGTGGSWTLVPWERNELVRKVFDVGTASIEELIMRRRDERRCAGRRRWMTILAPVLGFAPGPWQQRWANRWGYPAMAAVTVTSVLELLGGGAASLQLMVGSFGGGMFFPAILGPFMMLGPFLFVEGAVRLAVANAHGEPVGSVLGSPLLIPGALRNRKAQRAKAPSAIGFIAGMTLKTVLAAFASRASQARWGRRINVPPVVLTLVSALLECFGGLHDLARQGRSPVWLTLVSLAIFADGSIRLVLAGLSRGAVGSVFGWPFAGIFERWLDGRTVQEPFETGRRSQ